jgi:hypothetical protein
MFGQSSVFTLKQAIFPAYSAANSSITGVIIRHGPHHGAQNSTRTGISQPITRLSQLESVTTCTVEKKINPKNIQCTSASKNEQKLLFFFFIKKSYCEGGRGTHLHRQLLELCIQWWIYDF